MRMQAAAHSLHINPRCSPAAPQQHIAARVSATTKCHNATLPSCQNGNVESNGLENHPDEQIDLELGRRCFVDVATATPDSPILVVSESGPPSVFILELTLS